MKLLNYKHDKHLVLTVIVLVILPTTLGISNYYSEIYYEKIFSFFLIYFNDGYLGFQIINSFQYVTFIVMLIVYPLYPLITSLNKHFSKRNPRIAIFEYDFIRKIAYALFPFFILSVAFIVVPRMIQENPLSIIIIFLGDPVLISLFFSIMGAILFIVGSALLRIILLNRTKDFNYYFANMIFKIIIEEKDNAERMRYLIRGLSSYNKYVRKILGLQINDIKKIYSKVISDPEMEICKLIRDLSMAFEDNDKLKLIKYLIRFMKITDSEQFLVKESIGKKLVDWGGILGTLASTIAAILGALATLKIPGF